MQTMLRPLLLTLRSLPLILMEPTDAAQRPFAGGSLHPMALISIFKATKEACNRIRL